MNFKWFICDMPDVNHLELLGYYPDSVDTIYDMTLKAAFNRNIPPQTLLNTSIYISLTHLTKILRKIIHNFNISKKSYTRNTCHVQCRQDDLSLSLVELFNKFHFRYL